MTQNKKERIINVKIANNELNKLDYPSENYDVSKYNFYVWAEDIPFQIPLNTNPRQQDLKKKVAKQIYKSLTQSWTRKDIEKHSIEINWGLFGLQNNGIDLFAKNVNYDQQNGSLQINFGTEDELFGDINGGHTLRVIQQAVSETNTKIENQCVEFNVFVGTAIRDHLIEIAEARNTTANVKEVSLYNARGDFREAKEFFGGMFFENRINYDENGSGDLQFVDILSILDALNVKRYPNDEKPSATKQALLKNLLLEPNFCDPYRTIAKDIFGDENNLGLYDTIIKNFNTDWNYDIDYQDFISQNRRSKVKPKEVQLYFNHSNDTVPYKIPEGYIKPIFSALRALLVYDHDANEYRWMDGINPFEVLNDTQPDMEAVIYNQKQLFTPHDFGVKSEPYFRTYNIVKNYTRDKVMEKQQKIIEQLMKDKNSKS